MKSKATLLLLPFLLSAALPAFSQDGPLGQFDRENDIGGPKQAGSCTYDPATQEYTITGGGTNMWMTRDQFHFVWKKMKGDFLLRTRAEFVGPGLIAHRKVGWMVRTSLDPKSPYCDCALHGDGHSTIQWRATKGGKTFDFTLHNPHADVLQFERHGSNFIFSAARYGEPFVSTNFSGVSLGDDVYVGLFICSHTAQQTETCVFRDVRFVVPAKDNFTPYHDYIGSVLEILEPQTGKLTLIRKSAEPFEAPDWTRDGAALLYNVSGSGPHRGQLRRFDLASQAITDIDTGVCKRLNNDHVLSFDGTMLAVSDQSQSPGVSKVYTVPAQGGAAKLLTPDGPSYAHGWSPDGKYVVYTGSRNKLFDIYKMAADGSGNEIRLTDAPGLNDGPEYTPDGAHIYFNSSRTGRMQVWRMNPDGTDQQQVTDDEYNNWFPHVSPDGKWIVFISFPADVDAKTHPYYKHVYLRLMPIDGGQPKVIAYVYGGQGTINVPSWSPDSSKIAFVSNTAVQ